MSDPTRAHELEVCTAAELLPLLPCLVPIARDGRGRPRTVIVIRDMLGDVHAYLNRCEHLPIPLNATGTDLLTEDRQHLICRTHGACYRVRDGLCVAGPCEGRKLAKFPVEERGGRIYLRVRDV